VEKSDINPMSVQVRKRMVVKLTFLKLKEGMLRQKMLREKDI
jgi:hypothetical protein